MTRDQIREYVKQQWLKDKTISIPEKTKHLIEGMEMYDKIVRQAFFDSFTEAVDKRPKEKGFTRGMFGLDEEQIYKVLEKIKNQI